MTLKVKAKRRRVLGQMSRRKGHEVWSVTHNGQVKKLTTRRRSANAMDEAMVVYGQALQRLANR